MFSNRMTAIIVGLLFIAASATTLISGLFFWSIYDPNYLSVISANETSITIGALFLFAAAACVVAIPIVMYPLLKKQSQSLALGCIGARIFEGFFLCLSAVGLMALLSLSHNYVHAAAPAVSYFQTTGTLLLELFEWTSLSLDLPFALSAVIFNYLLYKTHLIPRWLSIWGLIGGAIWLIASPIGLFGITDITYFAAAIGIQEMALAVWLIAKGFNKTAIEPTNA